MRPLRALSGKADALAALQTLCTPSTRAVDVPLDAAAGRVLATEVAARDDVPGFDRSAMDGYALRAADSGPGRALPVAGRVPAGRPLGRPVPPGACVEIATGGALPEGADTVVPFEAARREADTLHLARASRPGEHVSLRGGDVHRGQVVLRARDVLTPARIALVGSLGLARVAVLARPRVVVLGSGSEVVEPGTALPEGGVFDGNSYALAALVRRHGGEALRRPPVPDEEAAYARALASAAADADLVVTTGGSSVGERDLLRATVEAAGGEVLVHGLRLRPGKPVLVGRLHGTPLLGLPGYPASAVVTAELLLVPAVRALAGLPPHEPATRRARLAEAVAKPSATTLVLPLAIDADGIGRNTYKESGTLTSVTGSWGYVEVPEGIDRLEAGTEVEVRRWS
ncbi:MAG TPA: gephyrin-like molybdotransferase Glp [Candidatus Thermoplasmatota archaeon]|nr:gephyrin-like molybdotransferase Glp [Candidatus Thermoplasmatota archaeon]